jgi:LacI family transcriptional regulator
MLAHLQGNLTIGQSILQCSTSGVAGTSGDRLERMLEKSKPAALIGICIKLEFDTIAAYKAAGVPVVLIDEEMEGASMVTTDNFMGGYIAGDHLAKAGRKKIGVVSGRMRVDGGYNAMQRVSGFIKAIADNGLTLPEGGLIEVISYSYNDGIESMTKFLDEKRDINAVFCAAGDMCAVGMLKVLRERGCSVPEQMALVGYDDLDVSKTSRPPLTTIKQPIDRIAASALQLVIEEKTEVLLKPKRIIFNPELVVRGTA